MNKLSIYLLVFILASCSKEDDHLGTSLEQGVITGKILIPQGLEINTKYWSVNSSIDEQNISENDFSVNTFKNSASIILAKDGDKVMLMGYSKPTESSVEVSIESTAKVLILCTPIIASLDNKFEIIDNSIKLSEFSVLKNEIKNSLASGQNLFNSQNEILFEALGKVIQKITDDSLRKRLSKSNLLVDPVHIDQDRRHFEFSNNHIAYSTIIGIYKEGERIKKIEIKGVDAFPTSFSELINGALGNRNTILADNKISESYNIEGDFNYELKIRTGLPTQNDGTKEYKEALRANLINASVLALKTFLPVIKNKKAECFTNLIDEILEGLDDAEHLDAISAISFAFKHTLNSSKNFYQCVYGENISFNIPYFNSLSKLYTVFNEFASRIDNIGAPYANVANLTFLGTQWMIAEPIEDICLIAKGNDVHTCCYDTTFSDIDGNTYDVTSIGRQCWMKSNLNVSHYRNGDIIPEIQDPTEWGNLKTGAWCYYENNSANGSVYGKLYNWYAANDSRGLAPQGWHIPKNSDWQLTLDNSFDGTSGGYRSGYCDEYNPCYIFGPELCAWWSSTNLYMRTLDSYDGLPLITQGFNLDIQKKSGYYVRCIRD